MSVAVGLIIRLLGLGGVSLSPFAAGAILAGVIAAAAGGVGLHLYNAGWHAADTEWQAKALQSKLDAANADLSNMKRAAADATLRAEAIEGDLSTERGRTASYVNYLKTHKVGGCDLDDPDITGMSGQTGRAGPARQKPAARPPRANAAGAGAADRKGR